MFQNHKNFCETIEPLFLKYNLGLREFPALDTKVHAFMLWQIIERQP